MQRIYYHNEPGTRFGADHIKKEVLKLAAMDQPPFAFRFDVEFLVRRGKCENFKMNVYLFEDGTKRLSTLGVGDYDKMKTLVNTYKNVTG